MTTEKFIPLHILDKITNGFSVNSIIGTGGYGNVYKGVHDGREIAVKLLHVDTVHGLDDQQFKNEVGNLLRVQHQNILQLVGYCYETRKLYVEHNSANNLSEHIYRVICFEYLQGGKLRQVSFCTRYNIIKGISEGLKFLQEREPPILHLDLKPANILLDSSMDPKVADFGLSRLFTQAHTHTTQRIIGTRKYMPPEYIDDHKISPKNDVFSLGVVMIDIMTGPEGYSSSYDMGDLAQLMQQVLAKWSTAIEATSKYPSDEKLQVQTCIKLAIRCVDSESDNRPDVADIVDTLNKTEINIPKIQLADVLLCSTIGPKTTMANTLKMMADELKDLSNHDKHVSSVPDNSYIMQEILRETTSYVEESLIIGMTEYKKEVLDTLCWRITPKIRGMFYHELSILYTILVSSLSNVVNCGFWPRPQAYTQVSQGVGPPPPEFIVLPIYGIGGIGKTTLAQLVFNDSQFAGYSRVWVYVSQNFDLIKIGNSMISQLSEVGHVAEKQVMHNHLKKLLAGKKVLIVLDDVWEKNPDILETLMVMLRLGEGSTVKVIVTTRDEAIAKDICQEAEPYKLDPLADKVCWKIKKQKSAFNDRVDKKHLKHIGRKIATKCGGVALAAQSLGYMLKHMEYSEQWESVRDSYIWNLSTSEGPPFGNHEVLASLLLSYSHMPDWLKLCFSYCAIFRKGQHIAKYDLIHQWIALGFIEQCDMFDPMQLCEKYVKQLVGMSFLQYSKTQPSSDGRLDKDVILFTMHDLVHDHARAILAHQINDKGNPGGERCRYALLTDCSNPLHLSVNSPANIKALHFLDCGQSKLCGGAFSQAIFLHVLDLSGCFIQEIPVSIGQLKQLRFLRAPSIKNQIIPDCITQLSELHYLNLRGSCYILTLPESIGNMKGLMHLDLSGCSGIRELPISFTELKQLVHLDLSHCLVSISEAFVGFTKLQYLNLSVGAINVPLHRGGLLEFIGNQRKLRYLNLQRCIQQMNISEDQIGRLLDSIGTLSNLEHLDLSCNYEKIRAIPESFGKLTKLCTLNLLACHDIKKLPDSMVSMVSLKVLKVETSVTLDESVLSLLNVAPLPHFFVHASSDKRCSNIIRLQPTNPVELMIDRLENVMSAEEAQSIKLIEKQSIEKLTFQWTPLSERMVEDKEVLEKLVPPNSVMKLNISGYRSVAFPDWIIGICQCLPNISHLDLSFLISIKNLPSLDQLPNLRNLSLSSMDGLEEWNTAYTSFLNLDHLSIINCAKLRLWLVGHYSVFPKLAMLHISRCAKLRIEPCMPRARFMWLQGCDNVLSSWGEGSSQNGGFSSPIPLCASKRKSSGESSSDSGDLSSSPITLRVHDSKVPLHQWRFLQHLPAIHNLMVNDCSDLTISCDTMKNLSSLQLLRLEDQHEVELPRWLVSLTSLQTLILFGCKSMTSLPQWLGELASLKKFEITYCHGIKSLPDSIQQLTKLEHLNIHRCPTLKEWSESEDNKVKLAHIRDVTGLYD